MHSYRSRPGSRIDPVIRDAIEELIDGGMDDHLAIRDELLKRGRKHEEMEKRPVPTEKTLKGMVAYRLKQMPAPAREQSAGDELDEAPGDGIPEEVFADAYKAHYEKIKGGLLKDLTNGLWGVVGKGYFGWPQWLALRSDVAMRPFRDIMPRYLRGHGLGRQFKDAVFDGHLSALSNLYARWENAMHEGNEAAETRDQLGYDRAHDELTEVIKQLAFELEALSLMEVFPGRCRFCPVT